MFSTFSNLLKFIQVCPSIFAEYVFHFYNLFETISDFWQNNSTNAFCAGISKYFMFLKSIRSRWSGVEGGEARIIINYILDLSFIYNFSVENNALKCSLNCTEFFILTLRTPERFLIPNDVWYAPKARVWYILVNR